MTKFNAINDNQRNVWGEALAAKLKKAFDKDAMNKMMPDNLVEHEKFGTILSPEAFDQFIKTVNQIARKDLDAIDPNGKRDRELTDYFNKRAKQDYYYATK